MKYSFVMAYYDRLEQLQNTLASINYYYKDKYDYEVVLVDDASSEEQLPELVKLVAEQSNCQYVRISKEEKGERLNPCIPFNIGFQYAKGDIIVIQNPENIHVGDVLKKIDETLTKGKYVSFGCYSVTKEQTEIIKNVNWKKDVTKQLLNIINPINNDSFANVFHNGWYNHSKHRPSEYHFLSAIYKNDLYEVGGFDESYAKGTSFDDDDFIYRIKQKFETKIIDMPFCLHQYHPHPMHHPNFFKIHHINQNLFEQTKKEKRSKALISRLYKSEN